MTACNFELCIRMCMYMLVESTMAMAIDTISYGVRLRAQCNLYILLTHACLFKSRGYVANYRIKRVCATVYCIYSIHL